MSEKYDESGQLQYTATEWNQTQLFRDAHQSQPLVVDLA